MPVRAAADEAPPDLRGAGPIQEISRARRTADLQPLSAACRTDSSVARPTSPHSGHGVRLRVRKPLSLPGFFGKPLCGQGLLSAASAVARRQRRIRGRAAGFVPRSRAGPRTFGHHGSRHQPYQQGRPAGRPASRVVSAQRGRFGAVTGCRRPGRSRQIHGMGRSCGNRLRGFGKQRSADRLFFRSRTPLRASRLRRFSL